MPIKLIIIDAGGVIHPDAEFGAPNQIQLASLTGLSQEQLNQYQDYPSLNNGIVPLRTVMEKLATDIRETKPDVTVERLVSAYKEGIQLHAGVREWFNELYANGYQIVICTNNSDVGIERTRELLKEEGLMFVTVYGSAELGFSKPDPKIFLHICEKEKVDARECFFIDDRRENFLPAENLGISVMKYDSTKTVNDCRKNLTRAGILRKNKFKIPPEINRGKYPSLFGMNDENKIIKRSGSGYVVIDEPNADGNPKKHGLYETDLAKLIVEEGCEYWAPGYEAINQLFLADFDRKVNSAEYISKVTETLKKERLIEDKPSYTTKELRSALVNLFTNFNLERVSQFYYNVWLFNYGPEPLEPFVFITDRNNHVQNESIRLLEMFPNMANSEEHRRQAYAVAQPWVTCGVPQLRGRQVRADKPNPPNSITIGIIPDKEFDGADETVAKNYRTVPHFAAKTMFAPQRNHPVAKALQAEGASIIGGSSGTLGRNVYMLAPLVQKGLLSHDNLMRYVMGLLADLIYRGHHSDEEIAIVAADVLAPLKPWFDPVRDPIPFYEQLLTKEFLESPLYRQFKEARKDLFERSFEESYALKKPSTR